jgi:hypothetical protein
MLAIWATEPAGQEQARGSRRLGATVAGASGRAGVLHAVHVGCCVMGCLALLQNHYLYWYRTTACCLPAFPPAHEFVLGLYFGPR